MYTHIVKEKSNGSKKFLFCPTEQIGQSSVKKMSDDFE